LYIDYQILKTKIKKYYGLRSKIVHHAEYTHINEELLEELSCMVAWVVITMASLIDKGYTSLADVQMQVERLDKINMPTILRIGPFRFFFYSNENGEPAHIHIQRERMLAKFWLKPVALASSTRFSPKELRKLETLVIENRETFLEAWNEYFSS